MLMLNLQYFGYQMGSMDSLEMSDSEHIEGKRRRGWQKMRELDSTTDSMAKYLSKLWEIVKDRKGWHSTVHWGHKDLNTT